ncbi:MAG: aldo/keto reductase [Chitinophagaceae bacterium]|nr:MAG: aldo/keto reductase [Chitinophagaceae bacterium]
MIRQRQLGKSSFSITEVSFGCMSLTNSPDAIRLIHQAVDSGINFFDTADLYDKGANEALLGKAVKDKRNQLRISSKVGNQWRQDGSGWDWNPSKKYILSAIDRSLERLGTDHLDLYLLHGGTLEDPIDESIEAFERLIEQGKILSYGISSIRPNVIREWVSRSGISAVMTQYSFLDRRPEEETLQLLNENGIGVLARGTIAGGLLAGKKPAAYLDMSEIEVARRIEVFQNETGELPSSQAAVRFAAETPGITTAVVGIRTQEQLKDAIASSQISFGRIARDRVASSALPNTYTAHR